MDKSKARQDFLFRQQRGKQYLKDYLKELTTIFDVNSAEILILSLEETDYITEQTRSKLNREILAKEVVLFNDKERLLSIYADKCHRLLPNKIYVFTDYSKDCGVAVIDKLTRIKPTFSFDAEHGGLISILSEDLSNELILDFYEEKDEYFLEIEVLGNLWGKVNM